MTKRHPQSPKPAAQRADAEKQDAPTEGLEGGGKSEVSHLESYLEEHRGKIGLFMVLAVVAVVVTAWVIYSRGVKEKEAAIEFTAAATVADYNLVIERHGGTVAGGNAALMKAKLQWDAGEQSASVKTLEQFLGNFPKHPLGGHGLYALAVREAALGNADVAKKRLKEVLDAHAESAVAPYAQLYLADLALGEGDEEMAKNLYDAAAKMDPGVVGVVERRLEAIKAKTPLVEIEAPPLPKEEVTPPVDPAKPVEPPVTPVDPAKPVEPPVTPVDPAKPVEPPVTPVDPAKPVEPPVTPADPAKPAEPPVTPVDPAKPAVPAVPGLRNSLRNRKRKG